MGGASNSLVESAELLTTRRLDEPGLTLLAPIFDGGRLREGVRIANAEQEAALAAYRPGGDCNAFSELENNLDQGVVVQQRIVDLEEAAARG